MKPFTGSLCFTIKTMLLICCAIDTVHHISKAAKTRMRVQALKLEGYHTQSIILRTL